jgi:uncharacterized protein
MSIITDPLFYALAIPAVIALGLSKGGFAGAGEMATPLLALVMPPLEAAAIFLPIMIVQDASAVWVYRKDWDGRILAIMIPGAFAGIALASRLAAYVSNAAVRVFIGVTSIVFVVWSVHAMLRHAGRPVRDGSVRAGMFWVALSGFTSTLCQAGGPPYQVYVLSQKLPEDDLRRHHGGVFRGAQCGQGAALSRARAILVGRFRHVARAAAACAPRQPTRLLAPPQDVFYKITLGIMLIISFELTREGAMKMWR